MVAVLLCIVCVYAVLLSFSFFQRETMYSRTDASSIGAQRDPPKKLFITTGAAEVG